MPEPDDGSVATYLAADVQLVAWSLLPPSLATADGVLAWRDNLQRLLKGGARLANNTEAERPPR